jgi:hypothetical protein
MRELALRRLTTPLAAARKDPAIDEAVVFVERLFGRPLKSNPDVLVLSDGNREEFLECVKQDFPKREVFFSPLHFLLKEKDRRRVFEVLAERGFVGPPTMLSLMDLLRPLETYRALKETVFSANGKRVALEQIAGVDHRTPYEKFKTGVTAGVHLTDDNIVVSSTGDHRILVHELVHSEDDIELGRIRNAFDRTVFEGRATFAERLSVVMGQGRHGETWDPKREYLPLELRRIAKMAPGEIAAHGKDGVANVLRDTGRYLEWYAANSNAALQQYYLPYAIALFDFSRAIGNAFTAFRIATGKPPRTDSEMRNPMEFYKQEIEAHAKAA